MRGGREGFPPSAPPALGCELRGKCFFMMGFARCESRSKPLHSCQHRRPPQIRRKITLYRRASRGHAEAPPALDPLLPPRSLFALRVEPLFLRAAPDADQGRTVAHHSFAGKQSFTAKVAEGTRRSRRH